LKLSIVNFESKISFLGAAAAAEAADAAADEGTEPPLLLIAAVSVCGSPAPIALDTCFFPMHSL
jgi:hypothetical protein